MTYTYENAKMICSSYNYLIGRYLHDEPVFAEDAEASITDICIVPGNPAQLADFLEHYKTEDQATALLHSGFNADAVRIVVIFEQTFTAPGMILDLDEYLTKLQLDKKYSDSGVFRRTD